MHRRLFPFLAALVLLAGAALPGYAQVYTGDGSLLVQPSNGSGTPVTTNDVNVASLKGTPIAGDGTAGSQAVGGTTAAGAADAGNPVKVGCKYNSTLPTYADGQRGDAQCGTRGAMNVQIMDRNGSLGAAVTTFGSADALSAAINMLGVGSYEEVFNGSTWDRRRSSSIGTGVAIAAPPDYSYLAVVTGDTQIKASAGFIHTCTFSQNDAAPTAGSIIIYDNTAESGTQLYNWAVQATAFTPFTVTLDVKAATGLYLGFTTTNDVNVSCSYR